MCQLSLQLTSRVGGRWWHCSGLPHISLRSVMNTKWNKIILCYVSCLCVISWFAFHHTNLSQGDVSHYARLPLHYCPWVTSCFSVWGVGTLHGWMSNVSCRMLRHFSFGEEMVMLSVEEGCKWRLVHSYQTIVRWSVGVLDASNALVASLNRSRNAMMSERASSSKLVRRLTSPHSSRSLRISSYWLLVNSTVVCREFQQVSTEALRVIRSFLECGLHAPRLLFIILPWLVAGMHEWITFPAKGRRRR